MKRTHEKTPAAPKRVPLRGIFLELQTKMERALNANRALIHHPGTQGDTTELDWLEMLNLYLPQRYHADKAFVIDHTGELSEQIDVVIYDRQYSPLILKKAGALYVPAESVYAVFEVKPELNASTIAYAGKKTASVRHLRRTSAPIPHAGGRYRPKKPPRILSGFLALEAGWKAPIDKALRISLSKRKTLEQVDLGVALRHPGFEAKYLGKKVVLSTSDPDTALVFFFLRLLGRLQAAGTVAALDFAKYSDTL